MVEVLKLLDEAHFCLIVATEAFQDKFIALFGTERGLVQINF